MKTIDKGKIFQKIVGGYLFGVLLLDIARQFSQIDYNISLISLLIVTCTALWAVHSEVQ